MTQLQSLHMRSQLQVSMAAAPQAMDSSARMNKVENCRTYVTVDAVASEGSCLSSSQCHACMLHNHKLSAPNVSKLVMQLLVLAGMQT